MTIDEQHEFHFARDDLEDCDGSQHRPLTRFRRGP
jgi:hypothetical protein